jgi:hypothetical protein
MCQNSAQREGAFRAAGRPAADHVPSGELDRLRETIEVLSGTELVRDLREGLTDARAGRVFIADQIAADLATCHDAANDPSAALYDHLYSRCGPTAGQLPLAAASARCEHLTGRSSTTLTG